MPVRLYETEKVKALFEGWNDAMFRACLEGCMGEVLIPGGEGTEAAEGGTGPRNAFPESACLHLGDFYLFAGKPDAELLQVPMSEFTVLIPADSAWKQLLSGRFPAEEKAERFAIRKDTVFDLERLEAFSRQLPEGVALRRIDGDLYDLCMKNSWSADLVQTFPSKADFLEKGLGVAAVKDGEILAGCSSYARCSDAIEVEVDTRKDWRRRHLATACAAELILVCLERGLYPSWDAMNRESVGLAEKLGYRFDRAYTVYNHSEE